MAIPSLFGGFNSPENNVLFIIADPSGRVEHTTTQLTFSASSRQFPVGGIPTPLKNMSSSVGMMTFPVYGKS